MKYFFLLFVFAIAFELNAQNLKPDKLIKTDKTQIEARVVEITETSVKYRKFSNLDGPIYSIDKNLLVAIIYANGESDVFGTTNTPVTESPTSKMTEVPVPAVEKLKEETPKPEKRKLVDLTYEGGYARFTDLTDGVGGAYLGTSLAFNFSRAFSTELAFTGGTFFPDTPDGVIGITKLGSAQLLAKCTYRVHFSRTRDNGLFFTGGAGYTGISGEFTDYTQKGTPTYKLDGYGGWGFIVGGGIKFGKLGILVDYNVVESTFSLLKLGLIVGL